MKVINIYNLLCILHFFTNEYQQQFNIYIYPKYKQMYIEF